MGTSKRYNSVPVKDNYALCLSTPIFSGSDNLTLLFKFTPINPCCHGKEFWDKIDYNSAPVKDNCALFAPTPYFQSRAIQWCHVNFFPEDPCCHGNQPFLLENKIG